MLEIFKIFTFWSKVWLRVIMHPNFKKKKEKKIFYKIVYCPFKYELSNCFFFLINLKITKIRSH